MESNLANLVRDPDQSKNSAPLRPFRLFRPWIGCWSSVSLKNMFCGDSCIIARIWWFDKCKCCLYEDSVDQSNINQWLQFMMWNTKLQIFTFSWYLWCLMRAFSAPNSNFVLAHIFFLIGDTFISQKHPVKERSFIRNNNLVEKRSFRLHFFIHILLKEDRGS